MTCLNGSFSLEFKTYDKNGLLFYIQKGSNLFLELKLSGEHLKLRADFGTGDVEMTSALVPLALVDGNWQSVEVIRKSDVVELKVNNAALATTSISKSSLSSPPSSPNSLSSSSLDQQSPAENESFAFIGGFPREYDSKKSGTLAVPLVEFEPRFRGSVRNLFYRNCSGVTLRPEMLSSSGILTHDVDRCLNDNPCLNGGRCLTTDDGRICECKNTEYEGDRCEIQKNPSDATFLGAQYISYDLTNKGGVMVSNDDNINLDFRTKQSNAFLLYIGNFKDYIIVVLKDGVITVQINLGSGILKKVINPKNVRFDDNNWHQLHIRREAQYLNIEVDGMYMASGSTTGAFAHLSSSVFYLAGHPKNSQRLATGDYDDIPNFKGCMRKVVYKANNIRIDLTTLAREGHSLLKIVGDVHFDKCQELADSRPVTFATPDAYITVATWDKSRSKGSIAFQFRTVEQNGLLMYSNGNRDSKDFFALEFMDGNLYLVFNMGSGIHKKKATEVSLSDGYPHDVFFEFHNYAGSISVDGRKTSFETHVVSDRFDLHGELYVGGIGPAVNVSALPREIWSALGGFFYVGCLQDLVVNGNMVDIAGNARQQNRTDVVGYCQKILSAGHTLGDDRWHTVFIRRRLGVVEVSIDGDRPVRDVIPSHTFTMKTSEIFVGRTASPQRDGTELFHMPHRKRSVQPSSLMLRDHSAWPASYSGFIGSMQSFLFNGKDIFQMASLGHANIEKTAQVDPDEHVVREPITFKSVDAYAALNGLVLQTEYHISMQFKTTEKNGLILYNGGSGNDFLALELSNGFLYYVYNMGEGEQRVRANVIQHLSDNKWHELRVYRTEISQQMIRVDDRTPTIDDLSGAKNRKFDLDGKLYLGGVEKTMYPSLPKMITSRHGFVGCLGSIDLNRYHPNVMREAKPITESVGDGCRGPITKCVNDSCANFGRCVQQWNTYSCDCDMTSYTGPMCTDESVSYSFGPRPGLITFTYPSEQAPSTQSDSLAFGFQTHMENAVLLRIDSIDSGDFIQIELLKGNVYVVYNMGTLDHPIGSFSRKTNDGNYHVVRFTRAEANATLQVDSEIPLRKIPTGKQSHIFNNQAYIKIGGDRAINQSIVKHFEGTISGKPDLFTDDEDLGEMQSTQPHTTSKEGVTEDIIYAGSGCHYDSAEDCSVIGSGTGDEIITGVVVVSSTTTTPRPDPTDKPIPPCKGHDCESSSRLRLTPGPGNTLSPIGGQGSGSDTRSRSEKDGNSYEVNGQIGIGNGGFGGQQGIGDYDEDSTAPSDKSSGKGGSSINLGLILGVLGSVLLAVIVLAIAFCKLRSRDEGTYKVDETQNFSALQSKKTQGNGAMASGGEASGKRGKKKDVKEWYV
ncbi:hypothetical protein EGW08_013175 [Elysia chlorotica]|uniref:EGF-like domain-containing protein n=1 Tax=Elysia chlorotica TaxID=188477 RepID=A0A433TC35_ELYCH|nr:hypothetical protein EGW08_013175 [Elysia chlorotica]